MKVLIITRVWNPQVDRETERPAVAQCVVEFPAEQFAQVHKRLTNNIGDTPGIYVMFIPLTVED